MAAKAATTTATATSTREGDAAMEHLLAIVLGFALGVLALSPFVRACDR